LLVLIVDLLNRLFGLFPAALRPLLCVGDNVMGHAMATEIIDGRSGKEPAPPARSQGQSMVVIANIFTMADCHTLALIAMVHFPVQSDGMNDEWSSRQCCQQSRNAID
jgi:hypothetical protein